MKASTAIIGLVLATLTSIGPTNAQQSIVQSVSQGCAKELQTYCKDVTMGEGRVASCLYAYEDKLSLTCAAAVYRGVVDLEKADVALKIYARQCSSDLMQYCSGEVPGGGRLFNCLKKNKATLTKDCSRALKDGEPMMRRLGLIQ
ncbi:MAG: hypothetical protein JSR78_17830 [Proteobacteria bacterium]|nr:hypothetical protein [Pseudomonadota bacterium]